jgi:hypothetical protein
MEIEMSVSIATPSRDAVRALSNPFTAKSPTMTRRERIRI